MKIKLNNFLGKYAGKNSRIFVISDLHLPYQHPDALAFLKKVKDIYKPTRVISIGDLFDQYSFSRYDKDPEADNSVIETKKARIAAKKLAKIFPNMDIVVGNHDIRILLKARRAGLPAEVLRTKHDIYDLPKTWVWHDPKLIIDDICFVHGRTKVFNKLSKSMSMNTVQGHHHSTAGVTYWASPLTLRWDCIVGCLADPDHYSQEYSKNDVNKMILGSLIIEDGQPTFLQMKLKRGGRWDKKVR